MLARSLPKKSRKKKKRKKKVGCFLSMYTKDVLYFFFEFELLRVRPCCFGLYR